MAGEEQAEDLKREGEEGKGKERRSEGLKETFGKALEKALSKTLYWSSK